MSRTKYQEKQKGRPARFGDEELARLRKIIEEGGSPEAAAAVVGVSPESLPKILARRGLSLRVAECVKRWELVEL